MQFARCVVALGALLASVGALRAQERVDNPEYASWSRFKKGTSISMRSINMTGNRASEVITTSTLLEIGPDKVLIESTAVVKEKVMDFKAEPEKKQEPRTILLPQGLPKGLTREDYLAGKPPGATEEGTETLTIGGRQVKTKWYKHSTDVGKGNALQGKLWISRDVPGNVVKSEVIITGTFASTLKLELVELKIP